MGLDLNKQLEIAIQIACDSHKGQLDKSGSPYILHPLHIMNSVDGLDYKIVAVLHDVIEDTLLTYDDLISKGIDKEFVDSILILTKEDLDSYMEYIEKISHNKYATVVKIEDLKHNMDLTRLNRKITNKDLERNKKYMKAYFYLKQFCN